MNWTQADIDKLNLNPRNKKRQKRPPKLAKKYGGFLPCEGKGAANALNKAIVQYLSLQKEIQAAWRQNNGGVFDQSINAFRAGSVGMKGLPDVLAIPKRKAIWVCVEGKAKGDRISQDQQRFGEWILKGGGIWICAYSFDQFKKEYEEQRHKLK
jgi:hypothetical protein